LRSFSISIPDSCPLFFFHPYGDHRDLHSFPTRRSSDLGSTPSCWRSCSSSACAVRVATMASSYAFCSRVDSSCSSAICRPVGARSEEHTSELQSRGHLVCRLLLEKKKNDHIQDHVERRV